MIEEVASDFLNKSTYIALLELKFTLLNLMLWTKNSKIKLSRGILSLDLIFLNLSRVTKISAHKLRRVDFKLRKVKEVLDDFLNLHYLNESAWLKNILQKDKKFPSM